MASIGKVLAGRLKRLERFKTRRGLGFADVQMRFRVQPKNVQQGIDDWQRKVLFKTGGYGRTLIKRSMDKAPLKRDVFGRKGRYRSRPPYSRIGTLRKLVLFSVDMDKAAVSWGVARIQTDTKTRKGVPRLLEEGGVAHIMVLKGNRDRGWTLERVRAKYRKYPYVAPQKPNIIKFCREIMEREAV